MPKLIYALLCADVIIDRESGAASFIRTFEHGTVRQLPATVPPCYVATLWDADPKARKPFSVGLTLLTPSGKEHALGANEVAPTNAALHKLNFHIPVLRVEEEGRHEIVISVVRDGKPTPAIKLPLYVILAQDAQQAETDKK